MEVLRKIRKNPSGKDVFFVMMSVDSNKEAIQETIRAGADDYIVKPFTPAALREKIFGVFAKRMDHRAMKIQSILNRGAAFKARGEFYKALTEFKKALQVCETAETHYQIGHTLACERKGESAISSFEKAIALDFLFLKAYAAIGDIHMAEGRYQQALGQFRKASRVDPSDLGVQISLGTSYLKLNRWDKAKKSFRKALALGPGSSEALAGLCETYVNSDEKDKALELIDHVRDQTADKVDLYNRVGIVYRKKGDYDRAIESYRRAIAIDPENEVLRFNVAKAYLVQGDREKATEALKRSLRIKPDFADAAKLLKEIEGVEGRTGAQGRS